MPIPLFLLGVFAAGATALGFGAQLEAKEINEKAQKVADDAQILYDDAKMSLEIAQGQTEKSLLKLGTSKKRVLETSIDQFLTVYDRIKNIELSESLGLDEIKHFTLEKQDVLELREMSNIYQSTFSSGAAGAATGAVISLAASGSLPVMTGALSVAGSALAAGEIGMAAGLAGSALGFGAAMTPLAAIAAPAVLFSGISANMKAEENLEKARTMQAEAEAAAEKMKTSELLCVAIADRADMFDNLLLELNTVFSNCTALLDAVTKKKIGFFRNKTVDANTFTENELELVAVTRSLAGAVKSVIDTPILTNKGTVSSKSQEVYEETKKKLPLFIEKVDEVKRANQDVKAVFISSEEIHVEGIEQTPSPDITRNIFAILSGFFASVILLGMLNSSFMLATMGFSIATLFVMNNDTESKFFDLIKNLCSLSLVANFSVLFYKHCLDIVYMKDYIIGSIALGVVSMNTFTSYLPTETNRQGSFKRTMARLYGCVFFFCLAIFLYAFLYKFVGISHTISAIITVVLYAVLAFSAVFAAD